MKKFLRLAGAAVLLAATPALADKPAKSKGQHAHATHNGHKASAKAHGKAKQAARTLRDRNRNRIDDRDEALARKYGGALCPPGLAKKTPECQPPGQAKRMFREGQRLGSNYRHYTPYNDIPLALRERFDLGGDRRYVYRDNVIYAVDPSTRRVTDIINAIL